MAFSRLCLPWQKAWQVNRISSLRRNVTRTYLNNDEARVRGDRKITIKHYTERHRGDTEIHRDNFTVELFLFSVGLCATHPVSSQFVCSSVFEIAFTQTTTTNNQWRIQ